MYEQDGHLVVLSVAQRIERTSPAPAASATTLPRGDWIVFTSDRNGDEQFRIYLIRPDGTALHKLTDFIIRFDGTGLQQLTDDQREDGTPIWFSEPVVKLASSKASHP